MEPIYGRGKGAVPIYRQPITLCFGSFFLFSLIAWLSYSPVVPSQLPDGISERGELLWQFGLFEEAVELEQENNKMATQLNAMAETEANYQQKVTEARHQLTLKQRALKLQPTGTGCGDLQQQLELCQEDTELMQRNYEALYNNADQVPALNKDFIVRVRNGLDDPLSDRMKEQLETVLGKKK